MKAFATEILAVNPLTPKSMPVKWAGPNIFAPSWEEAERFCAANLGYLRVIGEMNIQEALDEQCASVDNNLWGLVNS